MNVSLPRRLLGLVLVALIPVIVLSCAAMVLLARQQRAEIERTTIINARAVIGAVDSGLGATIDWLELLLTAEALEKGDLQAFHDAARRAVQTRPQWLKLILLDRSGSRLLDTAVTFGTGTKEATDAETVKRVVDEKRPVVGNFSLGLKGAPGIPVRVPHVVDGEVKYVLTAVVNPEFIRRIMMTHRMPSEYLTSVIDASDTIVTRSRREEKFGGKPVSPYLKPILAQGKEGWGEYITQENQRMYAGFSRSPATGWAAVIGAPEEAIEGPVLRSYLLLGAGIAVSLVVGLLSAALLSRRVTVPIARLRTAALSLGRGEMPSVPPSNIPELEDVSSALRSAGEARLRAESARERALQDERRARQAAEEAVQEKERALSLLLRSNTELERFAHVASHDLQTPLRSIISFTELLSSALSGKLGPDEQDWMHRVRESARRMRILIEELLAYARIDAEQRPFTTVDLQDIFRTATEALHSPIEQARAEVSSDALPTVPGDRVQLSQVMQNLIGNAVKYRGERPPKVHVSAEEHENEFVISVTDNGIGIDPQYHEQIFDIFQRLHAQHEYGGTGIGLAICRRVINHHGGRIWVESVPGEGATFRFTLPKWSRAGPSAPGAPGA